MGAPCVSFDVATISSNTWDVNTDFEIGKSRTRCPGHGSRLGIDGKSGKSRTESRHGIIADVADDSSAYGVRLWEQYSLIQAVEQYRLELRGM